MLIRKFWHPYFFYKPFHNCGVNCSWLKCLKKFWVRNWQNWMSETSTQTQEKVLCCTFTCSTSFGSVFSFAVSSFSLTLSHTHNLHLSLFSHAHSHSIYLKSFTLIHVHVKWEQLIFTIQIRGQSFFYNIMHLMLIFML